jgi:hypothetical protein
MPTAEIPSPVQVVEHLAMFLHVVLPEEPFEDDGVRHGYECPCCEDA